MRIERLRIHNFRRFADVDLELPDGVTALIGRNGAGKSTLLESIGWALYGHDAARTGKDLIRRHGAGVSDDVRVHLAFLHAGHTYEVTRELLGKQQSHVASIAIDGAVVVPAGAQSHKEVTQFVERLFHMDRQAFFTSLVARQRELAALTDAPASTRKKILIGLLRLDAVDAAIGVARQRRRDARNELRGLRAAMKDVQPLVELHAAATKSLEADAAAIEQIAARIALVTDAVEEARAKRDESRKRAESWRAIDNEARLLEQRLQHLAQSVARHEKDRDKARASAAEAAKLAPQLAELPALAKRLETLAGLKARHEELARCRTELEKARAASTAARAELEAANAAVAAAGAARALTERVEAQRAKFEAQLVEAQQRVATEAAAAQDAARRLADAEGTVARIRAMGPESPCPTCTRPLHEHHDTLLHGLGADIEGHRARLATLAPQVEAARAAEAEARQRLKDLQERERELRGKLQMLAREEARAENAKRRVAECDERAQRLTDQETALAAEPFDPKEHADVRARAAALEKVRDMHARFAADASREPDILQALTEAEASLAHERKKHAEAVGKRDALGFDAAAHDALEAAATVAETRLTDARVQREKLVGERARRQDEVKRLLAEIESQRALAGKAAAVEARATLLERLAGEREQGLLPEFKDHLIGRIRPVLSLHAGRLFRELTDGRYADLEVGEDYGLLVHEDADAFALERFSGGEGDLANLCLRLAVSQVVAQRAGSEGFGFLALDEVFGSQDETRKANILRALTGLSGRFRQILLITHISDIKEAAENVLRVEALDDGTSRVVLDA